MAMTGPWKVASALATCTAEKLVDISDPVCELPVIWSDHPAPADVCDCECDSGGHGQGWVRYVQLAPVPRPSKFPPGQCTGGYDATIEVGVHRCAPTLDNTTNPPKRPDVAEQEAYAQARMRDMRALIAAWTCCQVLEEADVGGDLLQVVPTGPQGGCGGVVLTGRLQLTGCPC